MESRGADVSALIRELASYSRDEQLPSESIEKSVTTVTPPDPSNIIHWGTALRYLHTYTITMPRFEQAVKEMMRDQRQHEELWWRDRTDLQAQLATRNQRAATIHEILQSAGAALPAPSKPTKEQMDAELQEYDSNVLRAAQHMFDTFCEVLAAFKVPFFAVSVTRLPISDRELRSLKSRMILYLEQLYAG